VLLLRVRQRRQGVVLPDSYHVLRPPGQCCCCYYRGNFPCDKFAPCEVGCCSVMCVDKKDIIMEAESGDRERTSTGAIEATVVEKGGAPALAEEMER